MTTIPEPCAITVPADPDVLLQAARDALKARVAALTERETDLRNQLDQVIGDRTIATGRLTDLDTILGPTHHPAPRQPANPAPANKQPRPATAKKPSPPRATSEQARERWTPVFEWVTASKADGTYSIAGLVARFGTWAKNWAAAAKGFGITIAAAPTPPSPAAAPAAPAAAGEVPSSGVAPGQLHLECVDCEASFPVTAAARLNSHCRLFHGRGSTETERTPIAAG